MPPRVDRESGIALGGTCASTARFACRLQTGRLHVPEPQTLSGTVRAQYCSKWAGGIRVDASGREPSDLTIAADFRLEPLPRSSYQPSPQGRECDEPRHAAWHHPFGFSRAWDRVAVHSSTRPMWKIWCKRQRSRVIAESLPGGRSRGATSTLPFQEADSTRAEIFSCAPGL